MPTSGGPALTLALERMEFAEESALRVSEPFDLQASSSFGDGEQTLLDEYDQQMCNVHPELRPTKRQAADWRLRLEDASGSLAFDMSELEAFVKCFILFPMFRLETLLKDRFSQLFQGPGAFNPIHMEPRLMASMHSRAENSPSEDELNHWRIATGLAYNASRFTHPLLPVMHVATQHPTAASMDGFWMIVKMLRPRVIILLNGKEFEKLKIGPRAGELPQYFPPQPGDTLEFPMCGITVRCQTEERLMNAVNGILLPEVAGRETTVRTLQVECTEGGSSTQFTLQHIQCNFWRDQTAPPMPLFLRAMNLADFYLSERTPAFAMVDNPPTIIVHCTSGVGRSGTYIAVDQLSRLLHQGAQVDVDAHIRYLRQSRMNMVGHPSQYVFIYKAALAQARVLQADLHRRLATLGDIHAEPALTPVA